MAKHHNHLSLFDFRGLTFFYQWQGFLRLFGETGHFGNHFAVVYTKWPTTDRKKTRLCVSLSLGKRAGAKRYKNALSSYYGQIEWPHFPLFL